MPGESVIRLNIGENKNSILKNIGIRNFKSRLFVILLSTTPKSTPKQKLRITKTSNSINKNIPKEVTLPIAIIRLKTTSGRERNNPNNPAPTSTSIGRSRPD